MRNKLAVVTVLATALLALTACTSKAPPKLVLASAGPSATTRPTPSGDPKVDAAKATAIAVVHGALNAFTDAAHTADDNDPELVKYVGGGALVEDRFDLSNLKQHGGIELGNPTATILSTKVDLTGEPPTVTVLSCVDYSSFQLVYQATHKPVPNSALPIKRYTMTSSVQQFANGKWLLSKNMPHRSTPC